MTPVQKLGIVAGKRYIARGKGSKDGDGGFGAGMAEGCMVVLSRDDNTTIPYFNRISQDGTVLRHGGLLDLDRVELTPVVEGISFAAATRTIETTVITIDRKLTTEEQDAIAAIIEKGAN